MRKLMKKYSLLQVLLALPSLFLSKAQDVIGSGPSCLALNPAADGMTRVTFLREDAVGVRSLFLTLWSEDLRLLSCEVNDDQLVMESYRAICASSGTLGEEITQRYNISSLLAPDAPCALRSSSAPEFARRTRGDETEGKVRRKRSWYFPGTMWCGTGSRASSYDHLGKFQNTDKCCREHDHCQHIIPAGTKNYGFYNSRFFTVSHCDCDQRFRQCLLSAKDGASSPVGYSFFSFLRVPCFELRRQRRCTEIMGRNKCRAAKNAPHAIFKTPRPYNSSEVVSTDSTESPKINQHTNLTKSKERCKLQPRGDTFSHGGKKGKGCKRHRKLSTAAPSQIPSISKACNTASSMETSLLHASKSSTLMPNTAGKKNSIRNGLTTYSMQRSRAPQQVTTDSYPQRTSTTQKPTLHPHIPTAITAETKTTKSHKNTPKHMTTVTPSTTTHGLLIKMTTSETLRFKKTTTTPKRHSWSEASSATVVTAKPTTAASIHKDDRTQKQMDSHLQEHNSIQEPTRRMQAPNTHAERGWKLNIMLHNMTDNQLLCKSLTHLDRCKYKIPPLETKYDLQNAESKIAYHCDCTSRLAAEIEGFKQPSVLPQLLMDFVSQYCFKVPKQKKCHITKSCSGSFTKASDLLQALKKIEKYTAGVRNSGNDRKRGIPVRFFKRCLRLERIADMMAQLTRL